MSDPKPDSGEDGTEKGGFLSGKNAVRLITTLGSAAHLIILVGAIGSLLGVWTGQERLGIFAALILLLVVVQALTTWALNRESAKQQAAIRAAQIQAVELNAEIEKLRVDNAHLSSNVAPKVQEALDRRFEIISNAFHEIIIKRSDFDEIADDYISLLNSNRSVTLRPLDKVRDAYLSAKKTIVNSGVEIMNTKKQPTHGCSINVKFFRRVDSNSDGLPGYFVSERSTGSVASRFRYDRHLERHPVSLYASKVYKEILTAEDDKRFFRHGNVKEYVAELEHERGIDPNYPFSEPSRDSVEFYNSCLIVPIEGSASLTNNLPERAAFHEFNEWKTLGLMCVDSKDEGLFDETYDLCVMQQLAMHLFSCYRTYINLQYMAQNR